MKWTAFLLAAGAICAPAQQFFTGQAARLVIGQKPFTAQEPGTSERLLGSIGGVAYAGDTLVVADSNKLGGTPQNHRILIYRNVGGFVPGRKSEFPQEDYRCPACVGEANVVLGQPDFTTNELRPAAQNTLRAPVGVAYNGRTLAVADTDNNRVLIWRSLPTTNQQNADFVVGQPNFTSTAAGTSDKRLRGPQAVWLDSANGLWVADTSNDRVLYFGEVTSNEPAAKVVIGQPDFNGNQQQGRLLDPIVKAESMLAPSGVMTDGQKLYVSDLGLNRVLIWNSIPSANNRPADIVIGQPDMVSAISNNSSKLCASNGTGADGKETYPARCAATLSLPRAAYSDGRRLFVADAGNDRVLVFNEVPRADGVAADVTLGQADPKLNQASDSAEPERVSSTDSFRTPVSLAWDGENLYVADTYNRRVVLYTPGEFGLPLTAVRNAASPEVYARGSIVFSGELKKDDELIVKIGNDEVKDAEGDVVDPTEYKYKVKDGDDFDDVIDAFIGLLATDPYVIATPNKDFQAIIFTARAGGVFGNDVTLASAVSPDTSTTVLTTSGANLTGGQNAARVAPFAIITILGENLADQETDISPLDAPLPFEKGGVEVFVDGKRIPIIAASPSRILAQLPMEVTGSTSASAVVRTRRNDGSITVSAGVAIPLIEQQPAIYADSTAEPRPGFTYHLSSQATGTVSVDGTAKEKDVATVKIRDRSYSYTVQATDSLENIRDQLVDLINANDPEVEAFPSGNFTRIRLRARVAGPAGNGIPFSASANTDANVIMSAFNSALCCANEAGALVTEENPALPGETIVVLASGLGVLKSDEARDAMINGRPYDGPVVNDVAEFVSSLAGGKTANVLFSGLRKGAVGIYEVHLELNPDLPTNPKTELTISQSFQTSNVVTIPVVNPKSNENPQ